MEQEKPAIDPKKRPKELKNNMWTQQQTERNIEEERKEYVSLVQFVLLLCVFLVYPVFNPAFVVTVVSHSEPLSEGVKVVSATGVVDGVWSATVTEQVRYNVLHLCCAAFVCARVGQFGTALWYCTVTVQWDSTDSTDRHTATPAEQLKRHAKRDTHRNISVLESPSLHLYSSFL